MTSKRKTIGKDEFLDEFLDGVLEDEVLKDEVLKGKPRRMLTRPGRLRARSGSKLPAARFRSGP